MAMSKSTPPRWKKSAGSSERTLQPFWLLTPDFLDSISRIKAKPCLAGRQLVRDFRSPFFRADILRVLGEKPVVAVQVLNAILAFAVNRDVQLFHDFGASRFRPLEMRLHIGNKHCEALGAVPELGWA